MSATNSDKEATAQPIEPRPQRLLRRRNILLGLAGLAVVGGGSGYIGWRVEQQMAQQAALAAKQAHTTLSSGRADEDGIGSLQWFPDDRRLLASDYQSIQR